VTSSFEKYQKSEREKTYFVSKTQKNNLIKPSIERLFNENTGLSFSFSFKKPSETQASKRI